MSGADGELQDAAARAAVALDGRALACAESCTAGLVMQAFAAVDGSSDWLRGGIVAYQRETKRDLLDVDPSAPLVSSTVAEQMARGVAQRMDASVTVATTGAAGPGGLDGAPPGTVVVAIYADGAVESHELHYADAEPSAVVHRAAYDAITLLAGVLDRTGDGSRRARSGTQVQTGSDRR